MKVFVTQDTFTSLHNVHVLYKLLWHPHLMSYYLCMK